MTNATVDETVSATQDTPVSDDEPTLLSDASGEEGASVVEEQATQGEEHSEDTTTVTTTPEERRQELQAKVDGGEPLTSEEKTEFQRLEQADTDRKRAESLRRENARRATEDLKQLNASFGENVFSAVTTEMETAQQEGRQVSPSLLKDSVLKLRDAYIKEAKPLVLVDLDQNIGDAFFAMGDDADSREAWDAATTHEAKLNLYVERYAQARMAESTDAKKITRLEKEKAELQAEVNKLTGDRGAGGSGATTDGKNSTSGKGNPQSKEDWQRLWRADPEAARKL